MDTIDDRAELLALFGITVDLTEKPKVDPIGKPKAEADAKIPAPPISTTDGKYTDADGERETVKRIEKRARNRK